MYEQLIALMAGSSGAGGGGGTNWALASNGGSVTATSEAAGGGYPIASVINGNRTTGGNWGSGGGWNSDGSPPHTVEVTFASEKTIDEINVFGLRTSFNDTSTILIDEETTFANPNFTVDYWDDDSWENIGAVTDNALVWNQFTFAPVATTKIRVVMTTADGRIVEIEARES